jgi:hypothetical protein
LSPLTLPDSARAIRLKESRSSSEKDFSAPRRSWFTGINHGLESIAELHVKSSKSLSGGRQTKLLVVSIKREKGITQLFEKSVLGLISNTTVAIWYSVGLTKVIVALACPGNSRWHVHFPMQI